MCRQKSTCILQASLPAAAELLPTALWASLLHKELNTKNLSPAIVWRLEFRDIVIVIVIVKVIVLNVIDFL